VLKIICETPPSPSPSQAQRKAPTDKEAARAKAAPKKINLLDLKRCTGIGIKMSKLRVRGGGVREGGSLRG